MSQVPGYLVKSAFSEIVSSVYYDSSNMLKCNSDEIIPLSSNFKVKFEGNCIPFQR